MRDNADEKNRACGCMVWSLSEVFPPVDRSGQGDSNGGVASQKQRRRKSSLEDFFSSRGDLMAVEDSEDEGGGGRSAIRLLDGLSKLEPWQNPNLEPSMALISCEMREEKKTFLY